MATSHVPSAVAYRPSWERCFEVSAMRPSVEAACPGCLPPRSTSLSGPQPPDAVRRDSAIRSWRDVTEPRWGAIKGKWGITTYLDAVHRISAPRPEEPSDVGLAARASTGDEEAKDRLIDSYLELASIILIKRMPGEFFLSGLPGATKNIKQAIDVYVGGSVLNHVIEHLLSSE